MSKKEPWLKRLENLHPYQTMLYLGMFGSGLIFLFLTVAFISSGFYPVAKPFKMPISFVASTIVILISGYSVSQMLNAYQNENIKSLKNHLTTTFILGLIFTGCQLFGWVELTRMGFDFKGLPQGSFLYILSGIHIIHLIGAMIFALIMVVQYQKKEKDMIQQLVLYINPFEKMRIELFRVYWYFMDIVWLVLFFLFLVIL